MKIPPALKKEIAGIPAWAWALTLILFLAFIAWKRRQGAESEALEDEELGEEAPGGTSPIVWPGPVTGPSEESEGIMSAIDGLGERISDVGGSLTDQIGEQSDFIDERIGNVQDQLGESTETLVEAIGPGYNSEEPPKIPGGNNGPGGNSGGKGNGQLRPLRQKRARQTGRIKEIRRGGVTKKEKPRLKQVIKARKKTTRKIKKKKAA